MFIQTEETPDPATLRFLPGREVLATGTLDLPGRNAAAVSPLAERLFAVPGVARVVLGPRFVEITQQGQDWQHLKPEILGAIMDHFLSGAPAVRTAPTGTGGDEAAVSEIREAIRRVIDPELGFNIVDLGLIYGIDRSPDGTTRVTMTTTTPGCPATNYLKSGAGEAALSVAGVTSVDVELTYEPRWSPDMMSPAAREHFGMAD